MNTLVNPTAEQVVEFCDRMKASLLEAIKRGSLVEIGMKQETKAVLSPEYGHAPVNELYVSARYTAKFRERGF